MKKNKIILFVSSCAGLKEIAEAKRILDRAKIQYELMYYNFQDNEPVFFLQFRKVDYQGLRGIKCFIRRYKNFLLFCDRHAINFRYL